MATRIIAGISVLLISLVVAILTLLMMLIAMNGYSESDATWGIGAFAVLAVVISIGLAIGAFFGTGLLIKRAVKPVLAAVITIPVCSIVAVGLMIVASLVGVAISEYVRVHY